MAATGSYNAVTDILTVTGDGLPTPVSYGTFPNANNPNSVTSYTFSHAFTDRGGDNTSGGSTVPLGIVGIAANGVALFNPSAGDGGAPPAGFNWIAAGHNPQVNFGEDECGGHPEQSGQYHYHDAHFMDCWKANQVIAGYNDYYGLTQFQGDNLRHPDGHSKILGYCFDGYPVYGPYGYSDPNNNESAVQIMKPGYKLRETEAVNRPSYSTYPAGSFMQDFVYDESIPGRHLDSFNGRFAKTPEFPSGTFAYFVTVFPDESENITYNVTVTSESDGNKYRLDGNLYPDLDFVRGSTYKFDQSDASNASHSIRFSTQLNGTHAGGQAYTNGVTVVGEAGQAGAYTQIVVPNDAPATIYYYCVNHSGMANNAVVTTRPNKFLEPKFPYMFGLASKEALNIPANQGIGQEESGGGEQGGGEGGGPAEPPSLVINNQPTNATIAAGGTQQFSVLAIVEPENGPINYQWQVSTDGGFAWSNVSGATSSTYSFVALAYMTGYRYRCILTGPIGAPQQAQNSPLASNLVILTVTGSESQIDYTSILKFDDTNGRYDVTAVTFDRDNTNPGFTTTSIRLDSTSYEFDLT